MQIFKFGGASVKDAAGVRRVTEIIRLNISKLLVVVVSAMGKSTNALEEIWDAAILNENAHANALVDKIIKSHLEIIHALGVESSEIIQKIGYIQEELYAHITESNENPDALYDSIVSCGERLSTLILGHFLESESIKVINLDARKIILTNGQHREAKVDWDNTAEVITKRVEEHSNYQVILTQGFISGSKDGKTTTLGREGSDFTAAILAYCLDAKSLTIWKDVPGILTGDPRLFDNVTKIDRLSYLEAIEMTYYGAKVIHPKTIKPLQNKQIPLHVRSFMNPEAEGTIISGILDLNYPPVVVIESKQCLLHITSKDFSFIAEDHLSELFALLNTCRVKVNMMRNTAISFTICVNDKRERINEFIRSAEMEFNVVKDIGLELITIRHKTPEILRQMKKSKIVLFEESLANTTQMVVKEIPLMSRK